jgi:hypothetical protein
MNPTYHNRNLVAQNYPIAVIITQMSFKTKDYLARSHAEETPSQVPFRRQFFDHVQDMHNKF